MTLANTESENSIHHHTHGSMDHLRFSMFDLSANNGCLASFLLPTLSTRAEMVFSLHENP
eukprot:c40337_g1_i1 orf=1-177(-)